MKPSVGRVVHYVNSDGFNDGVCKAAIITKTQEDPSIVGLSVFDPQFGVLMVTETHLDPAGPDQESTNEHWHWPERVDG